MNSQTVRVDLNKRGDWEIALPDQHEPVTCKTLNEAKRIAYLHATRRQPSELLMLDAYHRVLHHELIGN